MPRAIERLCGCSETLGAEGESTPIFRKVVRDSYTFGTVAHEVKETKAIGQCFFRRQMDAN